MKFTRAIALCALTLAIALAIGAISPLQPFVSAGSAPEHAPVPTPALATAAPVIEQLPAAPQVVQLPAPTPQVIYIQLPAAPPPQVIYVQSPGVEQLPAAQVEQPAVEQLPAAQVEQPANVYADLPTLECPCGVDAPAAPATDAQRAYSRARTR